ncbi:hypothetical protein, partial [Streptomyces thermogriseus]
MTSDSTKTTRRTRAALGAAVAVIGLVASPAVSQAAPAPQAPAPQAPAAQAPAPQVSAAPDRGAVVQAALTRVGMPYQ